MAKKVFDFSGYATKAGLKCSDGRVILKDAFKDNDGMTVPLVWQHLHNEPSNVLGHAELENRDDGVYAYCTFNKTAGGQNAKMLVEHGDITHMSIYANNLVEKAKRVEHGAIREVSLVLSGANPGARIDNVTIQHGDGSEVDLEDEAIIYTDDDISLPEIEHADKQPAANDSGDETVEEVFNTLSEKQKTVVYAIIDEITNGTDESGNATHSDDNKDEGDKKVMKKNVFENKGKVSKEEETFELTHEQVAEIFADAQKCGSLKESFLQHAQTYGIENIDYLFPDAKTVTPEPILISREMAWVSKVFDGAKHSPFSRIKSLAADITVETARALGYVKGSLKKEEVFALLRRTTTPTTVYKKQKLDRDDIVDITDLDVVAWLKAEMRVMLNEEIARAQLLGDGRPLEVGEVANPDKIDETCIRPIYTDDAMYSHKVLIAPTAPATDPTPEEVIDAIIAARVNYKGSGSPSLFIGTTWLTAMLLVKDTTGRRIYNTEQELAAVLRVSSIVEVGLMDGVHRDVTQPVPATFDLIAILVNMKDYILGADKGGQISMFDDFDIDYNQYKYLMETRLSGALYMPKSALVFEKLAAPVG